MDIFEYSMQNTERRIIENIDTIIHERFGKEIENPLSHLVSCHLPEISQFEVEYEAYCPKITISDRGPVR